MAEYIIANGQTLSNQNFGYGDTILVQSGGTLSDSVIPRDVTSVTLEDGAILSGSIKTAKEISVSGSVNAVSAELDLDISDRKPEDGLFLNSLFDTQSISITVSTSDQDKGTYRLFGDAAAFAGTISVKNELGTVLGTLSIENSVLEYDITRYTLSLNDANEVCVTVSSIILDADSYVLVYWDSELVNYAKSFSGLTISCNEGADGNNLTVLKGGNADQVTLSDGGTLLYYSGATVTNLYMPDTDFRLYATFDGDEESGLLSGTHQYSDFSYTNKTLSNLLVSPRSTVEVKNGVVADGLYLCSQGEIYVNAGSTLTGTITYSGVSESGITLNDSYMVNAELNLAATDAIGISAQNSEITGLTCSNSRAWIRLTNSSLSNAEAAVIASVNSTIGDVTASALFLGGISTLTGDVTVTNRIIADGRLDANGHTITLCSYCAAGLDAVGRMPH